jgi:hypothetical protein
MVNTTFSILTRHFLRTHVHSKHIWMGNKTVHIILVLSF